MVPPRFGWTRLFRNDPIADGKRERRLDSEGLRLPVLGRESEPTSVVVVTVDDSPDERGRSWYAGGGKTRECVDCISDIETASSKSPRAANSVSLPSPSSTAASRAVLLARVRRRCLRKMQMVEKKATAPRTTTTKMAGGYSVEGTRGQQMHQHSPPQKGLTVLPDVEYGRVRVVCARCCTACCG